MRYLKLGNLQPKILFKLFFILYWTFFFFVRTYHQLGKRVFHMYILALSHAFCVCDKGFFAEKKLCFYFIYIIFILII